MQRSYTLQPRWGKLILSGGFFAMCAAVLWYRAATVRRGVILEGVIRLDRDQAQLFYGALAAASLVFVALAAYSLLWLAGRKRQVEIDDDGITVPGRALRPRPRRILWNRITSARLKKFNNQVFLVIDGPSGKSWIAKSHHGDREFDEIVGIVAQQIPPPRSELPVAQVRS